MPAETGPGSLRDVRGRLEGEWVLEQFEQRGDAEMWVVVPSRGRLTYDRFGHLSSRGEQSDGAPLAILTYEGLATINPQSRDVTVADVEDKSVPVRKRRYAFDPNGALVVTMLDDGGQAEARATWRRVDRGLSTENP